MARPEKVGNHTKYKWNKWTPKMCVDLFGRGADLFGRGADLLDLLVEVQVNPFGLQILSSRLFCPAWAPWIIFHLL